MANCRPKYLRGNMINVQQYNQYTDNAKLWCVRVIIIAVELQ